MTADSSPDQCSLLETAIDLGEQLQDHLASLEQFVNSQQPMPSLVEDVVVLREKYRTVNRYIQFGDKTIRWIGNQTVLAVESQIRVDGAALVQRAKGVMERAIEPAPSFELIEADLVTAAEAIGQPYTEARRAWERVFVEAWREMGAVLQDFDPNRMVNIVVLAMCASVAFAAVNLLPAKHLRTELARRLNLVKNLGSHDEPVVAPDSSDQIHDTAPPFDMSENVIEYRFELIGEVWRVSFGQERGIFHNFKGMQHIAKFLSSPNKGVGALFLIAGNRAGAAASSVEKAENLEATDVQTSDTHQQVLDDKAKEKYEQRLLELSNELESARGRLNPERVQDLEVEYDTVRRHYQAALGLRGKDRQLGPPTATKKAMEAVRKALERTYEKMSEAAPPLNSLVNHLRQCIQAEGDSYAYRPNPPLTWKL